MAQAKRSTKKKTKKNITYTAQRSNPARGGSASGKRSGSGSLGREIAIILVVLAAVLLFLGVIGAAGAFGKILRELQLGCFGTVGYLFPFFFAFAVIYLMLRYPDDGISSVLRVLGIFVIMVALSGVAALIDSTDISRYDAQDLFEHGVEGMNGGLIGGALANAFSGAIGRVGAYVLFVFLAIICFVLVSGRTVIAPVADSIRRARERGREDRESRQEYREESRQLRAERRQIRREGHREERLEAQREAIRRLDRKVSGVENIDMAGQEKYSDYRHGILPSSASKKTGTTAAPAHAGSPEPAEGLAGAAPEEREVRINGLFDQNAETAEGASPFADAPAFMKRDYRSQEELARLDAAGGLDLPDSDYAVDDPEEASAGSAAPVSSRTKKEEHIDIPEAIYSERPDSQGRLDIRAIGDTKDAPAPVQDSDTGAKESSIWGGSGSRESSSGSVFTTDVRAAQRRRPKVRKSYRLPPMSLLQKGDRSIGVNNGELRSVAARLEETLRDFGVGAKVTEISCGPTVTRYELHPDQGVRIARIATLANDIKLSLAATDIRIEAPIPGKAAVGIEVPNSETVTVHVRDVLESDKFKNAKSILSFAVGKDIGGESIVGDISKMPHLLIAGATNSGKSVCINSIIISLLYRATPDEVKFIMVDPKQVELKPYAGIPHLLIPIVTDVKKASGALNWAIVEMEQRYKRFADMGVRDINGFNEKIVSMQAEYDAEPEHDEDDERPEKLCRIVIIVDEMADLMMVSPREVEEAICRLAQLARAAGIHLVLATQRPSVNVITGLIKANIPSRIAFAVASSIDSRIIIDSPGADRLLGKGDMLYFPIGFPKPIRVQGTFVSDPEIEKVVEFWLGQRDEATADRQESIDREVDAKAAGKGGAGFDAVGGGDDDDIDPLFADCGRFIIENDKGSIGNLQRRFKIGFNRAARIMDALADEGVVGPDEGKKPREVLMTIEQFEELLSNM